MTKKQRAEKGFTLAELLIVVAIIAVLVAVSIPIFTTHLERSREATDLANVRSAYAEIAAAVNGGEETEPIVVDLVQKTTDWQSRLPLFIGGVPYDGTETSQWIGTPGEGGTCTVSFDQDLNGVVFVWSSGSSGSGTSDETIGKPVFDAIERYVNNVVNETFKTSTDANKYARLRYSQTRITDNTSASKDSYGEVVAQRLLLDEATGSYRVNTGDSARGSMSGLAQELLATVKSDEQAKSVFEDWSNVNINYVEVLLSGDGQLKHDQVDEVTGYQLIEKIGTDQYTVYTRKGSEWTVETGTKAEMLASENAYNAR